MGRFWCLLFLPLPAVGDRLRLDFGNYTFNITCSSAAAQSYFLQGLMHEYGFNQAESQAVFAKALAEDATCAMCEWG